MKNFNLLRLASVFSAIALALIAPMTAHAASGYVTGAGPLSTTAKLDLEIVVDKFIYLQVGTGTPSPMATNATIDKKSFSVTGVINGTAAPVAGGTTAVTVRGNAGDLTLADNGAGNFAGGTSTIALSTISVATSGTAIVHGAWGSSRALLATAGVVNANDTWTFSYSNAALVGAGTYTKQITYTLTSL